MLWSVPEKTESGSWWRHISIIWFAILNIQVLQLLISPLSEIKSCGAVRTFYIKIIKRRTNQFCSLNQSIKKEHFFYFRQTELIQVGQSPPPPPPPPLTWLRPWFLFRISQWTICSISLFICCEFFSFHRAFAEKSSVILFFWRSYHIIASQCSDYHGNHSFHESRSN